MIEENNTKMAKRTKKTYVSGKPRVGLFPLYCFNVSVKKNEVYVSIPIQMRFDYKKYKLATNEIESILKPYGYCEVGRGTGFDGLYDLHYVKKEN